MKPIGSTPSFLMYSLHKQFHPSIRITREAESDSSLLKPSEASEFYKNMCSALESLQT